MTDLDREPSSPPSSSVARRSSRPAGLSSAASAAHAAIDHVHDWVLGTPEGDWVAMAVPSDGAYGVPEGLISSFPVTTSGGTYEVVAGLEHGTFSQDRIDATVAELSEEARHGA